MLISSPTLKRFTPITITSMISRAHSYNRYAFYFSPFIKRVSFSITSNVNRVALVRGLLNISSPSTVIFRVPKIVIYSINRMFATWSISHIIKKSSEAISPLCTHLNSTTTIPIVSNVRLSFGSVYYTRPYNVLNGLTKAMKFSFLTSARPSLSKFNIRAISYKVSSTITSTIPFCLFITADSSSYNNNMTVSDSRYINKFSHRNPLYMFTALYEVLCKKQLKGV